MTNDNNRSTAKTVLDDLLDGFNLTEIGASNFKETDSRQKTFDETITDIKSKSVSANSAQQGLQSTMRNLVPASCSPQEDYEAVFSEFVLGATIRERAFYRIWRLRNTNGWRHVIGINGEVYRTWEEFIHDIASNEILSIGRQSIFDRMKVYDEMEWLGYDHVEIMSKISCKPSLYKRTLDRVVDWDSTKKSPKAIMLPAAQNMKVHDARLALKDLIRNVESFPKQKDALDYIDQNILAVPKVDVYMVDDCIVVQYSVSSIDTKGKITVDDSGEIRFYPDGPIPSFVLDTLKIRIK